MHFYLRINFARRALFGQNMSGCVEVKEKGEEFIRCKQATNTLCVVNKYACTQRSLATRVKVDAKLSHYL